MIYITPEQFVNEIDLPNINVLAYGKAASYGTAFMMQSTADSDLRAFVESKTVDFLRSIFGEALTDVLIQSETLFAELSDLTEDTTVLALDTPDKGDFFVDTECDLRYRKYRLDGYEPEKEVRTGDSTMYIYSVNNSKAVLRITPTRVTFTVPEGGGAFNIVETKSLYEPDAFIRKIGNALSYYKMATPVSPLAYYVFYWVQRRALSGATSSGESDLNFSRASSSYEADKYLKAAAERQKLVTAWNLMVRENEKLYKFVSENAANFADYSVTLPQFPVNLCRTINSMNI